MTLRVFSPVTGRTFCLVSSWPEAFRAMREVISAGLTADVKVSK